MLCNMLNFKAAVLLGAIRYLIRGPNAAAEDGKAVDATAEDATAELCKKGGRYGGIT